MCSGYIFVLDICFVYFLKIFFRYQEKNEVDFYVLMEKNILQELNDEDQRMQYKIIYNYVYCFGFFLLYVEI